MQAGEKTKAEIALPFWQSFYAFHMQGVVSGALLHPTRERQITEDYQPPKYQIYTSNSNQYQKLVLQSRAPAVWTLLYLSHSSPTGPPRSNFTFLLLQLEQGREGD